MIQPYVYWRLNTPFAYIIGLYSNVVNGGMLDDPNANPDFKSGPQYQWLVGELKAVAAAKQPELAQESRVAGDPFPPHSGATNFNVRGDPSQGPTPKASNAPCLAIALQEAFTLSGQRPYAIFSAHAHLFQRITYAFNDGTVMPCLVAGCGGHSPLEELARMCSGESGEKLRLPFRAVTPGSFQFPAGDSAQVEYYQDNCSDDSEFGFLKLTFEARTLMCQFIGATSHKTLETSLSWTLTAVNTSNQVIARRAVPRPARDEAHHTSFTQPGSPVKG
jgi:hypothetical protein